MLVVGCIYSDSRKVVPNGVKYIAVAMLSQYTNSCKNALFIVVVCGMKMNKSGKVEENQCLNPVLNRGLYPLLRVHCLL